MKRSSVFPFIFFAAWTPLSGEDDDPQIVLRLGLPSLLGPRPGDSWSFISPADLFDDDDDDDDGWLTVSTLTMITQELEPDVLLDARKSAIEIAGGGKSHLGEN